MILFLKLIYKLYCIQVILNDNEAFKKIVTLCEVKLLDNSDCSNDSDDLKNHKLNSKRSADIDSNENDENSSENEEDHAIKKPK